MVSGYHIPRERSSQYPVLAVYCQVFQEKPEIPISVKSPYYEYWQLVLTISGVSFNN